MVGASKINQLTDDLERLQSFFDEGFNNTQIQKLYRTNSGHSLSRIHISSIRRGTRWNINKRSFIMKSEIEDQRYIETTFNNNIYKTVISSVITDTDIYYAYFCFIDNKPVLMDNITLMLNKPNRNDLLDYHVKFLDVYRP